MRSSYRREVPAQGYQCTRNTWRVSVSLTKALIEEIRLEAIATDLSFSEVVRNWLMKAREHA